MQFPSVDPSKEHMSASYLIQEYDIREKKGVKRVKNPEFPKSEVNPDCSLKDMCIRRSSCSGIRRSGETGYAKVKSLEARSPEVT
jgi:hypothetical protein